MPLDTLPANQRGSRCQPIRAKVASGDPKSVEIFICYSFGSRYRRDRNGLQTVQNAPKPHFRVILTHFWLIFSGGCPAVFEAFWSHTTAKSVQNVTQFRPKRLSKVLFVALNAGKAHFWSQKCALPVCRRLFSLIVGDERADFQRGFRLVPACGALLYHGKKQLMV